MCPAIFNYAHGNSCTYVKISVFEIRNIGLQEMETRFGHRLIYIRKKGFSLLSILYTLSKSGKSNQIAKNPVIMFPNHVMSCRVCYNNGKF